MISKIESLGTSTGKIIYGSDDCQNILSLPVTTTMELFKSSGILLFRDFRVTHEQMKMFAELFSSRFIQDYDRPQVDADKFVHFVDEGMDNCPPHSEHAYSPFRPDVIWFCCTVPAAKGGETLFWDGVRMWQEMSEETKKLFISKKLKFSHKNLTIDMLNKVENSVYNSDEIKQMLDNIEGVNYHINDNQTISIEYICSAVVKTKYGNQDAFANSFWVIQTNTEEATFEDGSRAPDEVTNELQKLFDRLTEEILWQTGDLVMIDNSRFMHGRKEFNDNRRQIFSTLSNLKF